jgi:outer membrane biosynthesis protein TonB
MKLLQYIQGNRKGKEINHLEKEAMKDPFLADALDGFDRIAGDDHELRINKMRAEVLYKTKSGNKHILRYLSIAAGILLIIGFGGYFLQNGNLSRTEENLAETQFDLSVPEEKPIENERSIPSKTLQEHPPEIKRQTEKPLPVQTETDNKKETAPVPAVAVQKNRPGINDEKQIETATLRKQETVIPDTMVWSDSEVLAEVADREPTGMEEWEIMPVEKREGIITGIVTDPEGVPLPGASIRYGGTNTGVTSNKDGYFELPKSEEKEIQISFIGYKPVNLVADTNKTMLVAMQENTDVLDEVVVVAFGKQRKESVTGSASLPEKKNIMPQPVIGKKEYEKYLKENKIMPKSEDCTGKKGKVNLIFSIDKNGRPANIRVKKSLCPEADREAIRLIEQGPDWTQGDKEVEIKVKF